MRFSSKVLLISAIGLYLLFHPTLTFAESLVSVQKDGRVVVNVLSAQNVSGLEIPKAEELVVSDVGGESVGTNSEITLYKKGDLIGLNIVDINGERTLDVTNLQEQIVEVQERPRVNSFFVSVNSSGFVLEQDGVSVNTSYTIKIDPRNAFVTLTTPTGLRYLSILPKEAVETTLRSRVLDSIPSVGGVELIEEEGEELVYKIHGKRIINIFNIYDHTVPVVAKVSASTAEIVSVDQPPWLVVLNYLLS